MSDEKVIVTKLKLDSLATSISNKSGVAVPLTIAQMKAAVDSISTGGGGGGTIIIEEIPNATGTTLQITTNGSSSPTTEIIIPEQTVTVSQAYTQLTYNKSFVTGDEYIWTINGTTGTATAISQSDSIGFVTSLSNDVALEWSGTDMYLDVMDSSLYGSYTVKVEKVVDSGGGSTPSATQHDIYFEFSDGTDATITAYYDDSFISDAITATTPTTYGNKTVTLAQLDDVTWYEVQSGIPLNEQLVDFTAAKANYVVNENTGQEEPNSGSFCTDFTPVDPSMTFSFVGYRWYNMVFYDSGKNYVGNLYMNNAAISYTGDYANGSISSTNIPSTAAYVRLNSYPNYNISASTVSLIRTA